MHIHILGICGTFMGGLAQLAKASGHTVSGSDTNVYPPMSDQLERAGVELIEGYDPSQLDPAPDLVVVGNALSRGNPCIEYMLNKDLHYTSGPQWLGDQILNDRWVLAVSGTHGKTSVASMLAWTLDYAGLSTGFLIGGVPKNFGASARLGESPFFVVEADEYDTAFFDKRSKFVHYRPRTLIMNNLEYDHADIFPDLAAIQTQFHHLVRTVPEQGLIIYPHLDVNLAAVLDRGCWSSLNTTGEQGQWSASLLSEDGSAFEVLLDSEQIGTINWSQSGAHNVANGLAAIAAARHVGVSPEVSCQALSEFAGVARRMEYLGKVAGIRIYDDFAHHPTAIATTLQGLRKKVGDAQIIAVIELRSNTMKMGVHGQNLSTAILEADQVLWFQPPGAAWSMNDDLANDKAKPARVVENIDDLVHLTVKMALPGAHIVIMSNGNFGGFPRRLMAALVDVDENPTVMT